MSSNLEINQCFLLQRRRWSWTIGVLSFNWGRDLRSGSGRVDRVRNPDSEPSLFVVDGQSSVTTFASQQEKVATEQYQVWWRHTIFNINMTSRHKLELLTHDTFYTDSMGFCVLQRYFLILLKMWKTVLTHFFEIADDTLLYPQVPWINRITRK